MRILKVILLAVLIGAGFVVPPAAVHARSHAAATVASQPPLFDTDTAAQAHCPRDTVVWLNTKSGIYHLKGERWYGRTKHGAFVCKTEADAAGDRETRNGQ